MLFLSKPLKVFLAVLSLGTLTVHAQDAGGITEAQKLANAERWFAQTSLARGIREAFVTYLADDAIVFQPGPIAAKQWWRDHPASKATLLWGPAYAETARSNDLGYTTGPSRYKPAGENKPTYFGQFVSVWKKQNDGTWKVRLDVGIDTPEPKRDGDRLQVRDGATESKTETGGREAEVGLFEAERRFVERAKRDSRAAFDQVAADDVRVCRDNLVPAVNKEAARELFLKNPGAVVAAEQRGEASRAGDLGFTFGESSVDAGHLNYVRIWRKEREWRLIADVSKPFPKPNE
jgi:ketosteroid isomerase-like protein